MIRLSRAPDTCTDRPQQQGTFQDRAGQSECTACDDTSNSLVNWCLTEAPFEGAKLDGCGGATSGICVKGL